MLKPIVNKLLYGSKSLGLDICFGQGEKLKINVVKTELKDNEIEVLSSEQYQSIEELLQLDYLKKIPSFVNFRGSGVLQKVIISTDEEDSSSLLRQVLPNSKPNDFYVNYSKTLDKYWVAIVRKERVDSIVNDLSQKGVFILGVTIGYKNIAQLSYAFGVSSVSIGQDNLLMENQSIIAINQDEGVESGGVLLDQLNLNEDGLIAYTASINWYKGLSNLDESVSDFAQSSRIEFKYFRWFKSLLVGALSILFIVLLFNFLYFQSKSKELAGIETKLGNENALLLKLNALESELKRSEAFFDATGLDANSNISFYADKLALTRLKGIRWDGLLINPPTKKVKKGNDVEFNKSIIQITGTSKSSKVLQDWIGVLENETWTKTVIVQEYNERDKRGEFNLQIVYE